MHDDAGRRYENFSAKASTSATFLQYLTEMDSKLSSSWKRYVPEEGQERGVNPRTF